MRRYLWGPVILAALGASFHDVTPALAACPSPLTGKDAAGTTQNFGVTTDASGNCYGNISIVDGSNAANKATVTSGLALKVDGSAVTQPVSGTVTANQGGAPWSQNVTQWNSVALGSPSNYGTSPGAVSVLGVNAFVTNTVTVSGTVTANQGGAPWTVNPGTAANWGIGATGSAVPANGVLASMSQGGNTTALTGTSGNLNVNLAGNSFGTLTISGTVTANQGTSPWVDNVSQFGGNNVVTGTGASGLGIPRVTVSNDSNVLVSQATAANLNATVVGTGTFSVQCTSGCTGGGGGGASTITNSSGQLLGGNIAGQNNIAFQTNQATTLPVQQFPGVVTQIWDGQHYQSIVAANGAALQSQTATAVRNPDTGNIADTAFGGSGSASQISLEKGIYAAVTSSIPTGANVIGGVTQSGAWTFQCTSGCTGSGGTNLANTAGQPVGQVLPGANNIPFFVNQAQTTLLPSSLLPSTGLWDGKNYASFAPPNSAPQAWQPALVVTLSPNSPSSGTGANVNVSQFGGTNVVTGTGASGSGIPRVTVSSDSSITANQGGTWTVQQGGAPWTVNPGTAANWGIGATGSAVPANAVLEGMSQGGNTTALTGTSGNLNVNLAGNSFGTLTVSGTVTANQGGAPWSQNITQFGGVNISTGTGASGTGIPRVTVSNDSNILATQSGAWTVAATQSGTWNVGQQGTWTVQQGTPPWNIVNYDTGGRQLGASLAGANNVPFVTTQALTTLAPASLLPSQGLWDGKNYASFAPAFYSAISAQPALVVAVSPNTPLPTGTNTLGAVTQSGGPWSVSGTVTANQGGTWTVQPGNTANTTPWLTTISQGGNTAQVNASSQLLVNCGNCSGSGVSQVDNTGFTFGTTSMAPIGGVYSAAPTQLTNGDAGVALLTQGRILEHNTRNSAGQELGQSLPGQANIPLQVNISSQVTNNTLVKQNDSYGQLRTASMFTDGTQYAALTAPNKPPRPTDSAIVVTPSPIPSLQCPFIQALNASATATVITGQAGKFLHVCSYKVVAAAALSFTLNEGTGTTCGTGTTALDGGGTGSIALAANGGFQTGSGAGQVTIPMQKAGDNLCVQVSTSSVSGYINYGIFN